MAYVKIIYQNSPSTATPINAQNLNHMDDGIAENDRRLNELETAGVVNKFNNRTGNVTPEKNDYDISLIGATAGEDGYVPVWRNSGTEQDPNWGFEMEQQGGSGHKILDADGSEMSQEDALQFADSFVSDDDVNGRTIVENIKAVTQAQYPSQTEDGTYLITDGEGAVIEPASDDKVEVTADGNTNYATLLNTICSDTKFETTKIKDGSYIAISTSSITNLLYFVRKDGNKYGFSHYRLTNSSEEESTSVWLESNNSKYYALLNGTITDYSTTGKPTNGTKITLYYGNKKAVVDLQTTANRCWMSDGETSVEDELNYSGKKRTYYGIAVANNIFIVILPPNIVEKGSPVSITSHRIVEMAVGERSYSSFGFNENGLAITTVDTNMTMGHAIRFTATITW